LSWDPTQYERFKDERAQPFRDLTALVEPHAHMRVADLGCGTGELTRELHDQLRAADTTGVDNSETMLGKSAAFATNTLRFERGDIETFVAGQPLDLIVSNAALHWIPDHERLFPRLVSLLAPSGQLAVQMPANHDHASHRIAAGLAAEYGIPPRMVNVLSPESYATLLHQLGFARQHVRLQVYGHVLPSTADIVEWTKGSTLTPYREALPSERYEEFLAEYTARLVAELGEHRPCFYTFKRVLFWGAL
jgi:trans-aconitate 2-methyltransferase